MKGVKSEFFFLSLSLFLRSIAGRAKKKLLLSSPSLHQQIAPTRAHLRLPPRRCMRRRLARATAQTLEAVLLLNKQPTTTTTTTMVLLSSSLSSPASSFSSCLAGSSRAGVSARRSFEIGEVGSVLDKNRQRARQ